MKDEGAEKITQENYKEKLEGSPVSMIDFWAEWCGPCKIIGPVVEELAVQYGGKILVGKVNVDENPKLAEMFGIRSIPTLLFFKGLEVVDRHIGNASKTVLSSKIEKHLKGAE